MKFRLKERAATPRPRRNYPAEAARRETKAARRQLETQNRAIREIIASLKQCAAILAEWADRSDEEHHFPGPTAAAVSDPATERLAHACYMLARMDREVDETGRQFIRLLQVIRDRLEALQQPDGDGR